MTRAITKGMLALALLLGVSFTAAGYSGTYTPGLGINGTPHDLSVPGANGMNFPAIPADAQTRICIWCHAPHNTYKLSPANGGPGNGIGAGVQAPDAFDYLPLWNHAPTTNVGSFTMYQNGPGAPQIGPKASQAIANGMTPGSVSLLCLSCHDGSVAVNAYGNASQLTKSISGGGVPMSTGGAAYVIGKDAYLGNHHPIGFDYDAAQAIDTEIVSADTAQLGGAGFVRNHLYGAGNTKMECGTCHSVHNTGNTGETLLWRSDTSSRLCLTCHAKGTDPGTTTP
ncbi:MAG TPA: cytochrome c3 family protein [Thermoanaerobaculia bacterium]|nr:cytochrome c3 family protein [Thermoanaerobaculia bacterium]